MKIYQVTRSFAYEENYITKVTATYRTKRLAEKHMKLATNAVILLIERYEKWRSLGYDERGDFKEGTVFDSEADIDSVYSVEEHNILDKVSGA